MNKGVWQISPDTVLPCAIKTLHKEASEDDRVKLLQEAAINGQFHHPNVVQLLGVVTVGEPVSTIMPYQSVAIILFFTPYVGHDYP